MTNGGSHKDSKTAQKPVKPEIKKPDGKTTQEE